MGAKNLVPAKYPRSLENCLCYPQKTMRVVATRVLRVCGSKSGSFSTYTYGSRLINTVVVYEARWLYA